MEPGYPPAATILESHGIDVVGVPVDDETRSVVAPRSLVPTLHAVRQATDFGPPTLIDTGALATADVPDAVRLLMNCLD